MAKGTDYGDDAYSLCGMPREIIDSIVSHLRSGCDVASLSTAIGQNASYWMFKHIRVRPSAWVRAGAPIDVVKALLENHLPDDPSSFFQWIEAAAGGGRLDVFMYVHALGGVDVTHEARASGWQYMERKRRRRIFEAMRSLLKAAVIGCGGPEVIGYILGIYDPRWVRPRRLFNSGILIRLSRHAINHRPDAPSVLEALHSHDKKGKCGCTARLAYDAARADRPDVLEWMADYGCSAVADAVQTARFTLPVYLTHHRPRRRCTTAHRRAYVWSTDWSDLALAAVYARAAASLAWLAPKIDRPCLVDAVCRLDDRTCQERVMLIINGALARTALRLFFGALLDLLERPTTAWSMAPWRLIVLGAMTACALAKMRKDIRHVAAARNADV